jgi:hypothetical protein
MESNRDVVEFDQDVFALEQAVDRLNQTLRTILRRPRHLSFPPDEARALHRLYWTSRKAARSLEAGRPSVEEAAKAAEYRRMADWALDAFDSLAACNKYGGDLDAAYKEACLSRPPDVKPLGVGESRTK